MSDVDVYIVGAGITRFGRHDSTPEQVLGAEAVNLALNDAGIGWADVDVAVGGTNGETKPDNLVATMGLTGLPFVTVKNGCATGGVALMTAANMLRTGDGDVACVVGYDNHSRGAFAASPTRYGIGDWYGESGMMLTTQYFALKIQRYLHDYGLTPRSLAMVSEKAYRNAADHPYTWRKTPVTVDEALNADMVNDPLTRNMFCAPDAGAVSLILATGDRAFDMCDAPVKLASISLRGRRFGSFEVFSTWLSPEERTSPSVDAAATAFQRAGISPEDVQVAQLQDTDSGAEVMHLAETGLVEHGAQEELLASGAFNVDGRLPVNTDGGLLANGEPVGASGLRQVHEVVRQLQKRAPGLQVPGDPKVGFTHVYGAPGISACSVLTVD